MIQLASRALLLGAILLTFATSLWAADGWYLLVPPRSDFNERADFLSGYKILDGTPLSQWGQQGGYDSASECEAVRNSLLMTEQRAYSSSSEAYVKAIGERTDPVALRMQRFSTEARNANVYAFMASRCIRSNDPRLRREVRRARFLAPARREYIHEVKYYSEAGTGVGIRFAAAVEEATVRALAFPQAGSPAEANTR